MGKRELRDTAVALLKAAVRVVFVVVVVGGSWLGGYVLVARQMFYHGDNTVPLFCSLAAGFAAGGIAIFLVRRAIR